jgi:hypothetical protein
MTYPNFFLEKENQYRKYFPKFFFTFFQSDVGRGLAFRLAGPQDDDEEG